MQGLGLIWGDCNKYETVVGIKQPPWKLKLLPFDMQYFCSYNISENLTKYCCAIFSKLIRKLTLEFSK